MGDWKETILKPSNISLHHFTLKAYKYISILVVK